MESNSSEDLNSSEALNLGKSQIPSSGSYYNYVKESVSNISGYWIAIIIIAIIAIIAIILGSMYIHNTYNTKTISIPVTSVPAYYPNGSGAPPSGQWWNIVGQMKFDPGYWQVDMYSYIFDKENDNANNSPSVFLYNYSLGLATVDDTILNYINGSGSTPWASQTNGTGWVKFQPSYAITNYWNMQIPSSTIFVNTNKEVTYSLIAIALFSLNSTDGMDPVYNTYESPFQISIQARATKIGKHISSDIIPYSS